MNNNIDQLKTEVKEIKNSLNELKNNVTLSEEERRNKAEALKNQAEATRQKIQAEIDTLADKTDDESKKQKEEADTLLNSFNEIMNLYNSILNNSNNLNTWIETTAVTTVPTAAVSSTATVEKEKWFFWKTWDWIWEQWSDVISWDKRKEQPWQNILRAVWFWLTWYAAYKWVKALWNRAFWDDEEEEEYEDEEKKSKKKKKNKKSFWDRWYWKALKWIGIWTWWYYVSRWLITWNWDIFWWNPFSDRKKDWPETLPWSDTQSSEKAYEKLSEDDKKIYESSASAINEYQWNIMWDEWWSEMVEDLMWDSDFDKDKIWLIPFMLSNRYASLDKMLGETSFYYEILGTEWHIAWDKLKNLWLDGLKKLLTPLVWIIDWLTFDLLNVSGWVDSLIDKLKSVEWLETKLRTVFRKSITVMSYYQSRKWVLESYLAEQELIRQDPKFLSLSEDDKIDEINEYLENEDWYKQYIESEVSKFMNLDLKQATTYLQSKGLLNWELDWVLKKEIGKIEEKRKSLLDIEDNDDISNLDNLKKELNNGKLSANAQKKLKQVCDNFEEEMFTSGKQTRYAKYLPMFNMLWANSQILHDIQQTWDYENIANKYKEQVNSILKKSENGTLQESDLDLLEETINDYYKFQKSLVSSEINIWKSVDENWNLIFRWWRSIWAWWQNICNGIQIVCGTKDGSTLEGAWLLAGWILSIDALTFWLAGKKLAWFSPFWALNKKVVFPIAKNWLKLTWKWIERLTWNTIRAGLPSRMSARFYNKDTYRIAVWRWEISLKKAANIAHRKWITFWQITSWNGTLVETPEHVVQYLFWSTPEEARRISNVVNKYWDNPQIYRQLFPEYYDKVSWARKSPTEWLHLNRANVKFNVNESALKKLEDIATRIDGMPAWTQKTIMQSMMKSIKTLDQAEDLAIMWVGDDMVRFLESWKFMKAEQYGKYLAKYAGKIDANDLRAFEKFIIEAKNTWKTWENWGLFVRNAMKNFSKIKENGFAVDKVDDLALNSSRRSKLSEATKANCAKMTSRLKAMVNNPKFKPFAKNISKQVEAVEDFSKTVTSDWMKAIKNMSTFWKESAFAKLSTEWMHELSRLSYMLRDVDMAKDLTSALKWAKTIDNVKDILKQSWIVVDHIDDAVLLKIAKSWSAKKINDIVNYGAWYNTIKWVEKFLQNPAVKQVWRITGRALVVLDFLLVWYDFYSQYNEAQLVKQSNLERWERKEWKAYFDLAAWWTGALAWAGMLIPGLMAIPWVGWVLGGVLAASVGALEIWNKYFKDIEKFKQNQADFLAKWIASAKQELTSIDSWDQWLSRTWIDNMSAFDNDWDILISPLAYWLWKLWTSSVEKKSAGAPKTKAGALEALIRMEELQKNPLAWADLNDPEVIKNQELFEAVKSAKQQVDKIVNSRFNYFKVNYLNKKKPLIDKSKYEWNQAISAIEDLLEKSMINCIMESDSSYQWDKNPEKYKESKLKKLKEWNEWNFKKLEKLYADNPTSLFQMYAELPYYKSMLSQYWEGDQMKLLDSCEYFEQYMSYKTLWKPITSYPTIDINPDNIDYNQIHNLISHFALIPTVLEEKEIKNYKWLSDKDILDKYWVSGILWQDILFECARLLNYDWKNSLDNLKSFFHESKKEVNWIYYDWENRVINENNWSDDEFAKDSELNSIANIEKMREYINDNINWSFIYWSMFTENSWVNKELWNRMLKVVDNYIALRKWNIKSWIIDYVKKHARDGNYISLPNELIIKWRKAWMNWAWQHIYKYEKWRLIVK